MSQGDFGLATAVNNLRKYPTDDPKFGGYFGSYIMGAFKGYYRDRGRIKEATQKYLTIRRAGKRSGLLDLFDCKELLNRAIEETGVPRIVLDLRAKNYTMQEIADITLIPKSTVGHHLKKIKAYYADLLSA